MKERLIELFQELTEDEKDLILDHIEHPTKRENPVTEATGQSLCEGSNV